MKTAIETMFNLNKKETLEENKAILREIVQSLILVGLSKAGFFNVASFYGGTALRIFYGLNRYSEDLDFTLKNDDKDFSLDKYIKVIEEVALSYGLKVDVKTKSKRTLTSIESAFCKLNTYQTFLSLKFEDSNINLLHKDEVLNVKFEVDTNPPLGFNSEDKWLDFPEIAAINVLDLSSLFAGKIAAILCRTYKNRVKGRDYYDYVFFIKNKVSPNLTYLKNKLIENGKIKEEDRFNIEIVKEMLINKFNEIDYEMVKNDASNFTIDNEDLRYYSKELFIDLTKRLK